MSYDNSYWSTVKDAAPLSFSTAVLTGSVDFIATAFSTCHLDVYKPEEELKLNLAFRRCRNRNLAYFTLLPLIFGAVDFFIERRKEKKD